MDNNSAHLQRLRKLFEEAPIRELNGQELVSCGGGMAEVRLPFKPSLTQGLGVIHGGMVGLVADTAGWFAAASVYPQGLVTTAEYKINLLTGAKGDLLVLFHATDLDFCLARSPVPRGVWAWATLGNAC